MAKSAERHHAIFGKMGYAYGIMLNIGKPNSYFHSGYVKVPLPSIFIILKRKLLLLFFLILQMKKKEKG
jgi:hypothetical protein